MQQRGWLLQTLARQWHSAQDRSRSVHKLAIGWLKHLCVGISLGVQVLTFRGTLHHYLACEAAPPISVNPLFQLMVLLMPFRFGLVVIQYHGCLTCFVQRNVGGRCQ